MHAVESEAGCSPTSQSPNARNGRPFLVERTRGLEDPALCYILDSTTMQAWRAANVAREEAKTTGGGREETGDEGSYLPEGEQH